MNCNFEACYAKSYIIRLIKPCDEVSRRVCVTSGKIQGFHEYSNYDSESTQQRVLPHRQPSAV